MVNEIQDIDWHDCEIESVIEIPGKDVLIYNVLYPEDWENGIYVPKSIFFEGHHSHTVEEIPFFGNPTILEVSVVSQKDRFTTIKLETNAGTRIITAERLHIEPRIIAI
jgi:hypothetical protein